MIRSRKENCTKIDGGKSLKLLLRAFVKLLSGMAAISLLLFVPMLIVGTILFIEGARSRPSQPQKADTLCRFRRGLRGD